MKYRNRHQTASRCASSSPVPAALLTAALVLALGCGQAPPDPETVATSDLGQTTRAELDAFIVAQPEGARKPLPRQDPQEWRLDMLRDLLTARALESEARASGLAESDETAELMAARRDAVVAEIAEQQWIQQQVNITEDDLQAFHQNHPDEFGHDEQIRVRHIFLRVDRNAPDSERRAVRNEIDGLLQQIRDGADFGELASVFSQSETAKLKGLIGKLSRGTLAPAIEDVIWALDEGEVSDVVETPTGFHIFRVENRIPAEQRPLEEVKGALTRKLTREAMLVALDDYLHEMLSISGAFYNPDAVLVDDDPAAVLFELDDKIWTAADWWTRFENQPLVVQREIPLAEQLDLFARSQLALWDGTRQDLASRPDVAERLAAVERSTLIVLAMQERRRAALDTISPEELSDYWDDQRRAFRQPKLYHLRLITRQFPDDPKAWYRVYEELDAVADEVRRGDRDFAKTAHRLSDDVSSRRGGDVGFVRLDSVGEWAGPNASKTIAAMTEGEISDPILIERFDDRRFVYEREGYMLVAVEEIQPSRLLDFDEARDEILDRYITVGSPTVNAEIQDQVLESINAVFYTANL